MKKKVNKTSVISYNELENLVDNALEEFILWLKRLALPIPGCIVLEFVMVEKCEFEFSDFRFVMTKRINEINAVLRKSDDMVFGVVRRMTVIKDFNKRLFLRVELEQYRDLSLIEVLVDDEVGDGN